jgi:uncharacterized protein RhaS with RHS repeats
MKHLLSFFLFVVLLLPDVTRAAYDPTVGVWLSRDPLGEKVGPNLYQYVKNNPVKYIDPLGLDGLDAAFNPDYALQLAEAMANADGSAPALSDVIANASANVDQGIQMAVQAAKTGGGDVDSQITLVQNVLKALGKKLGRQIVCHEQDLGAGSKALVGVPAAGSGTVPVVLAGNGTVVYTTAAALTPDGTALSAAGRALLGLK